MNKTREELGQGAEFNVYLDSSGAMLVATRIVRRPKAPTMIKGPKAVTQWHPLDPDGKRWASGQGERPPAGWPLFRLPELKATRDGPVYVVEGETCANMLASALATAGLPGAVVTSLGGASQAQYTDWSPLRGRVVRVIADEDEAGEKYADDVARLACEAGAKCVRVLYELPDVTDE